MANPKRSTEHDPMIRFLAVGSNILGICPICGVKGPAGKFCYKCCEDQEMLIGTCPFCQETGPLGIPCLNCNRSDYLDEPPEGECRTCGGFGIQYAQCSACLGESTYE